MKPVAFEYCRPGTLDEALDLLAEFGADASVLAAAHWVSALPGGRGAVREACELLLRAQGRYESALLRWLGGQV